MKARGNVRKLLVIVGEIQNKVGEATGVARNDRDPEQLDKLCKLLDDAFNLCLDARSRYDPIDTAAGQDERSFKCGG